jgi:hypothetical protein
MLSLSAMLSAMLSGANDLVAIYRWGRRLTPKGLAMLGIERGRAPCHATCHYVFRAIAAADLERALGTLVAGDGPGLTPHRAHRALSRAHWQIEHRLFRVGDGTFAEDACRVRTARRPQGPGPSARCRPHLDPQAPAQTQTRPRGLRRQPKGRHPRHYASMN